MSLLYNGNLSRQLLVRTSNNLKSNDPFNNLIFLFVILLWSNENIVPPFILKKTYFILSDSTFLPGMYEWAMKGHKIVLCSSCQYTLMLCAHIPFSDTLPCVLISQSHSIKFFPMCKNSKNLHLHGKIIAKYVAKALPVGKYSSIFFSHGHNT